MTHAIRILGAAFTISAAMLLVPAANAITDAPPPSCTAAVCASSVTRVVTREAGDPATVRAVGVVRLTPDRQPVIGETVYLQFEFRTGVWKTAQTLKTNAHGNAPTFVGRGQRDIAWRFRFAGTATADPSTSPTFQISPR